MVVTIAAYVQSVMNAFQTTTAFALVRFPLCLFTEENDEFTLT